MARSPYLITEEEEWEDEDDTIDFGQLGSVQFTEYSDPKAASPPRKSSRRRPIGFIHFKKGEATNFVVAPKDKYKS